MSFFVSLSRLRYFLSYLISFGYVGISSIPLRCNGSGRLRRTESHWEFHSTKQRVFCCLFPGGILVGLAQCFNTFDACRGRCFLQSFSVKLQVVTQTRTHPHRSESHFGEWCRYDIIYIYMCVKAVESLNDAISSSARGQCLHFCGWASNGR